jgi:catechol 2,3-dioxygenase-like lactoylglutathione lyase family enzyme
MIFGAHVVVYSKDAIADRAFLREVLGFSSVDAEMAVHPAEENGRYELCFMCDDLKAEISALRGKGASITHIPLPSGGKAGGGKVGLYQPKHPEAVTLAPN